MLFFILFLVSVFVVVAANFMCFWMSWFYEILTTV
jgi:hypothetical protein